MQRYAFLIIEPNKNEEKRENTPCFIDIAARIYENANSYIRVAVFVRTSLEFRTDALKERRLRGAEGMEKGSGGDWRRAENEVESVGKERAILHYCIAFTF